MKCKIKSYNAIRAKIFRKPLTLINKLILLKSSPFTHTEFHFSERYDNISFSATKQEGSNCARFKHIQYSHARERWDTVIVPMTDEEEDMAYLEAKTLEGTPYDLIGQLCHLSKIRFWKPSKKKIWCTKAVAKLIYKARPDFFDFLNRFSLTEELKPDQMDMMARYYFEPKPDV